MNRHSYSLQKYAGTQSRHTCPNCGGKRCFTRYIDEEGNYLSDEVGRCDHESACGYHYTPSDYFRDHPDAKPGHDWRELTAEERIRLLSKPKPQTPICTIPEAIITRSVRPEIHSNLTLYLSTILDPVVLEGVIFLYRLGVTKDRDTIFFQIDAQGRCRTGKIMKYNPSTGHRIKDENVPSKITWVHSLLKARGSLPPSWTLTQCLFGEHLLPQYPQRKVALVESEKTAVICAALMPSYIWLATGGKTQLGDKLSVLAGREVIAFPDVDGYEEWKKKLSTSGSLNIRISDYLEKNATPEDREAHIDIADLLLRQNSQTQRSETAHQKPENSILKYFAPEHREQVQLLIDELDLVPVSITKINKKA